MKRGKKRPLPSSSAAFECVEDGVCPPLPPRDAAAAAAAAAAGKDAEEQWNLAEATKAAFPFRFPSLSAARRVVRR